VFLIEGIGGEKSSVNEGIGSFGCPKSNCVAKKHGGGGEKKKLLL